MIGNYNFDATRKISIKITIYNIIIVVFEKRYFLSLHRSRILYKYYIDSDISAADVVSMNGNYFNPVYIPIIP